MSASGLRIVGLLFDGTLQVFGHCKSSDTNPDPSRKRCYCFIWAHPEGKGKDFHGSPVPYSKQLAKCHWEEKWTHHAGVKCFRTVKLDKTICLRCCGNIGKRNCRRGPYRMPATSALKVKDRLCNAAYAAVAQMWLRRQGLLSLLLASASCNLLPPRPRGGLLSSNGC